MSRSKEYPSTPKPSSPTPHIIPPPALPPQMAISKSTSIDEVAANLKRTPFFMTSLDDASPNDNTELEAMRALQYEGTRLEIASGFRENGNEMARKKKWTDGKEFYTKALAALEVPRKDWEENEDEKERELEEACSVNRALCNLELKNYRSTITDCTSALSLNPTNLKASYRLTLAHLSLLNLPAALSACELAVTQHPSNASLLALLARINSALTHEATVAQARLTRSNLALSEKRMLDEALKLRKIRTRKTAQPPELEDATIRLIPDPSSPTSTLVFPVILLYPLAPQSDMIKAFGEEQALAGHLSYLLPLPWDTDGAYTVENVEAYVETGEGGLVKWGKKVPLLKMLSGSKVEVVDGLVRVNVVPKDRAREWIEGFRKSRVRNLRNQMGFVG